MRIELKEFRILLYSVMAILEFGMALHTSNTIIRTCEIMDGAIFAVIAVGYFIAAIKEWLDKRPEKMLKLPENDQAMQEMKEQITQMEIQLDRMMRQTANVDGEGDGRILWETKYNELWSLYEKLAVNFAKAQEIIKEKSEYIKELEDVLAKHKEAWGQLDDILSVWDAGCKKALDRLDDTISHAQQWTETSVVQDEKCRHTE